MTEKSLDERIRLVLLQALQLAEIKGEIALIACVKLALKLHTGEDW